MLLALVLRLVPVCWNNQPPVSDGIMYHQLARSLIEVGTYSYADGTATAYWPPGYPLLLCGLYTLGFSLLAVKLFQVALGLISVWLAFLIGCRLAGTKAGLWTSLLLAVHPYHIFYCNLILTETLFVALFAGSLLFYCRVQESSSFKDAGLLGLFTGAGILVRPFFIMLPAFFILLSPKRFKPLLLTLFISAIIIAPWTLRNYRVFHKLIPVSSNGGINFWIGHNPKTTGGFQATGNLPLSIQQADENAQSTMAYRDGFKYALMHPAEELGHSCLKIWWLFMPDYGSLMWAGSLDTGNKFFILTAGLLGFYPLALAFAGLWGLIKLKYGFLWQGILFYILGVCCLFFSQPRYLLPFTPVLVISAATLFAGDSSIQNSQTLIKKRFFAVFLIIFIIVGIIYWGLRYLLSP